MRAPIAWQTQPRFPSARVIFLLLAFFGATLAAPAATVVRVLDYNIHRDIGGPDSDRDAQPALAKVVNYLNPDVWTINELGGDSSFSATFARADLISFVRNELTIFGENPTEGADFFVYVGAINDGFITNAIVSRFPFLTTRTYSDAGGGFAALRGLAMALVDLPGANDLGVFTAHLKAFNGTADAERRQAEADANSATMRGWLEGNPSAAAVLAGDFNETEDAGQSPNWSGHQIGDPLPSDGRPYQPITTFKAVGLSDARPVSVRGDKDTISASNPTRRFDYILFTPGLLALQSGLIFDTRQYTAGELNAINRDHGTSFVSTDSAIASDHLPVFAEFQIVPEPSTIVLLLIALLCIRNCRRNPRETRSFRLIENLPSSNASPRVRAARETNSTWMKVFALSFFAAIFVSCGRGIAAEADIVIADFEGADYGGWSVAGTAFGTAPARGTLPNQQKVDGFLGRGLVNTYHGGDRSTGELKSPPFEISRDYIAFLIGGGGFAEEICMQLLVDGKVVRSATGPNTASGGSETLNREVWDVREFSGRSGQIQIIDRAVGGWGHINVDDIVLTDRRPSGILAHARREIACDARYLNLPVKWKGSKRRVALHVDERVAREFEIILADQEPDFWVFLDLAPFQGKRAVLTVDRLPENSHALNAIEVGGKIRNAETLYREKLRPQFHFSSRRGWLNDPNGLVYEAGRYHLFYQHNPYGWEWGNMHWGHATSRDLVHWEELPIALYPRRFGDWAFSGSAVMDKANTSGWKSGATDVMVAAFTSTGRGECMVYSMDGGQSWVEHSANPVIKHTGRDPRVLWHAPTNRWVMALYSEQENKRWITFHSSPDLKTWQFESRIEGFFECPDLFELPVDGDPRNTRWVLTAANSEYLVGTFDGRRFQPESGKLSGHRGEHFYAAQTYTNMPDDRCVQIGWAQIAMPEMPFNQMMWFPCELRLKTTVDGVRLCWQPAREIEKLRKATTPIAAGPLAPGTNPLEKVTGDLFEMRGELAADAAEQLGIRIGDLAIVYDVARKELKAGKQRIPLKLSRSTLDWVILIDRMSVELFLDGGTVYIPLALPPGERASRLELFTEGGSAQIVRWDVHELRSIWGN